MRIHTKNIIEAPIQFVYEHMYSNEVQKEGYGSMFVSLTKNGIQAGSTWILEVKQSFLFPRTKKTTIQLVETEAPTMYRTIYKQYGFQVDCMDRLKQTDQGTIIIEEADYKSNNVATLLVLPFVYPLLQFVHKIITKKASKKLNEIYQRSITS
ncbi:hypothetical protein [Shimazuella alba]|uniref:Polyketide cyclase / dehydrase and lipid transport n=1 Tax=Shimazuella alba TaxID=2690964 RepID=A0A6I4VSW3_9BACL|nr:hypothetical protein [Shimazuella alba]MXQ53295.1 hypothetical protein [Shimazuella alba]